MKAIELLSCLAALAALTTAVEFRCGFAVRDWGTNTDIRSPYSCWNVTISGIENPTNVTAISGSHMSGRNNTHVKAFWNNNQQFTLATIPNGIENYFADLEVFQWQGGNISSINANYFGKWPNLLFIDLSYNKLVEIDGNLFQHTRKLQWIYFEENSLQHVGHDLFTNLADLEWANFGSNPCINMNAYTPQQIQELNLQLPIQCPPSTVTPDPPTTTSAPPTTTSPPPTTTAEPTTTSTPPTTTSAPPITTAEPTTTSDPPTTTSDHPTTTSTPPTTTSAPPTTTSAPPTTTAEPTTTSDPPTTTSTPPTTTSAPPITTSAPPTTTAEVPTSDPPTTSLDPPTTTLDPSITIIPTTTNHSCGLQVHRRVLMWSLSLLILTLTIRAK